MTEFVRTWSALLQPQNATRMFDLESSPPFEPGSAFDGALAWWSACLCEACYLPGAGETSAAPPCGFRGDVLADNAFTEVAFIDEGAIQGFLATRRGACFLVFRGTDDPRDWIVNTRIDAGPWPGGGWVHEGFNDAFRKVAPIIGDLRARFASKPWIVTGHSQGAAMAVLCAPLVRPLAVYGFGCPRLGDGDFVDAVKHETIYQVVNGRDLICRIPISIGDFKARLPGRVIRLSPNRFEHDERMGENGFDDDISMLIERLLTPRDWIYPIDELKDHAIVNYIAAIERAGKFA
jgi:hypothetical protein